MWLPTAFCILLVCITTTQAAEQGRTKRDLQFWKDVLAAKLGLTPPKPVLKEERVKIVRVPAFEQVLVRDAPKVTLAEAPMPPRIVTVDPTMTLIGSYLGTKSAEETIFAMQNMKQLVQSGLMSAREEVIEVVPPRPQVYVMQSPIVQRKVKCPEPRPVYPIFERPVVPMPQPLPVLPPIPVLPPPPPPPAPKPIPVIPPSPVLPPLTPVSSVVPVIPTRYSYKQGFADGSVTTYFSEGNQDVIVTETHGPPPPLPAFIFERLENIVYGRPTDRIVPVGEVVVGPVYQEPVLPIITGPSNVDVRFNSHKPQKTDGDNFSYKHVHSDGTMSTYAAAITSTNQPLEQVNFENISKLPPPPPQIFQRFPAISGGVYKPKPWGYSLKTSNGVSTYETLDRDKIFLSSVLPAVLSSPTDEQPRNPNKNVIVIEGDKDEGSLDEFGRPFISTAANGDKDTTSRTDIERMKKFPALPTPIAGESQSAARYSYKIIHNQNSEDGTKFTFSTETPSVPEPTKTNDYHGFGTNGFSYTQVNHDGTVDTFTGTKIESKPAVEAMKEIPALPAPIVSEQPKDKSPPVIINLGEEQNSGFSYTQINKEGSVTTISGNGDMNMPAPVLVAEAVPVQPAAIVDVIQPIPKPCKSHKKCKKPHKSSSEHSGFSYTQISNEGSVTKFTGDGQVQIPVAEVVEVPAPPPAIVDVIQPIPGPVLVEVGNKHAVEAIPSGFSYTQISNEGGFTKYIGDGQVQIPVAEVVEVPAPSVAFADVIQPMPGPVHVEVGNKHAVEAIPSGFSYTQISNEGGFTKYIGDGQVQIPVAEVVEVPAPPDVIQPMPGPVHVEVGKKHADEGIPKPVWSNYVYKQISHTNPQPFTVVKVGDAPDIEVPAGEVKVKVNKHWHERPDGTKYPCVEMHKVVPDAPIPPIPTSQMVSTVPEGFMYMPPENENGETSPHKTEMHSEGSHFSYTQVSSGGSSAVTALEASKDEPTPFHLNPIVVGPVVDNTYSYTQKHSDGSALGVQGEKDSTVTVTVHEGKLKTSDAGRGDIPEATS